MLSVLFHFESRKLALRKTLPDGTQTQKVTFTKRNLQGHQLHKKYMLKFTYICLN